MPIMIRDLARLKPKTVELWNGREWTRLLGMNKSRRKGDEIEILLRSGERIICTPTHRFPTKRGLLSVSEIRVGDLLKRVRLPEPEKPKDCVLDEDAAWFAGLYLAEGSRSGDTIQIAGHVKERSRWSSLCQIAQKFGGTATRTITGNKMDIRLYGKILNAIIDELVSGRTAKDKCFAPVVWRYSNHFIDRMLAGYISGDAHYDQTNQRYRLGFTRNYNLERDLRCACARLGYKLTLKMSVATLGERRYPSFRGELRFTGSTHLNTRNRNEIMEIRKAQCREIYDIGVADDSHVFSLASGILTHNSKPNPMPESVTDRPTSSHEYIFLLTKSGTSQYWTHREKNGVRSRPKADWRWVNQITDQEVAEAPPNWKEIIVCPECNGKGVAQIDCGYEIIGQWFECWQEVECPICKGKKKVQRWKRVNLWRGHDYFYDQDAVREKDHPNGRKQTVRRSTNRYKGNLLNPFQNGEHERWSGSRNLRSVWTFATKPYPEAHFATFPPELPKRCILAGTSGKGACPECGAPWERVVKKDTSLAESRRGTKGYESRGLEAGRRFGSETPGYITQSQTLGWRPTCSCGHKETVPCAVLDPFIGSGTTAEVAIDLDRNFFGIDLNRNYLKDFVRPRIDKALKRQKARKSQGDMFHKI